MLLPHFLVEVVDLRRVIAVSVARPRPDGLLHAVDFARLLV